MTATEVLARLETLGSEPTRKTLMRHGARDPVFGVKVADLKVLQKQIEVNHALARELYASGNSDAMYLAGLIADPAAATKAELKRWAKAAYWHMLSGYVVAGVAAESAFGRELAREWIESDSEQVANAGWSTFGYLVAIEPDADLDLAEVEALLDRVRAEIGTAPNRVRYAMNNFVISVGGYVVALTAKAKAVARAVGAVEVEMEGTACRVPDAAAYIAKIEALGRVGRKRKRAMC